MAKLVIEVEMDEQIAPEKGTEEKGLEGLIVWKLAMALSIKVCKDVLPLLPAEEKWALSAQLRRAVQSVPANIAEGYGRYYYQDTIRFIYIARGSLLESDTFLKMADQLGYFPGGMYSAFSQEIQNLLRAMNGYILYLKLSIRGSTEPGASIHEPAALYNEYPHADL